MKYLVLFLVFIFTVNLSSQEAEIWINTDKVSRDTISNNLYGSFIEFLNHFVNGPKGMWAQELLNRGFDMPDDDWNGTSNHWFKYGDSVKSENIWYLDKENLYNTNGLYSQVLETTLNNEVGICQNVFIYDSVSYSFYIYYKGQNNGPLFITIRDTNNKLLFQESIDNITDDWTKKQIKIPPQDSYNYVKLIISIKTQGKVYLDEASLMPDDNILGVRKEVYELYEKWKPGILRYPGGWYADSRQNKLEHCIGDIDQRQSPNIAIAGVSQRMDFGLHEYLKFCDTLQIIPHIALNVENGSALEAKDYLEYCLSDTSTVLGKKRASNGRLEPFKIKYWEVGNEQWSNDKLYANKYLEYYDVIKNIDSTNIVILCGNHWGGYQNFEDLFTIVGDKCDIYSYHPALSGTPDTIVSDEIYYLNMSSQNSLYEKVFFSEIQKWLEDWDLYPKVQQGITEWMTNYGSQFDWTLDTNIRNSSLESGICAAGMLAGMMKYGSKIVMSERTHGLGLIRTEINPQNHERHFFGTPSYHAFDLLRNHHGQHLIGSTIISSYYSLDPIIGFWSLPTNPYIDVVVTASKDTLYISVMSRYYDKNAFLKISSTNNILGKEAKVYRLWSENVTDANSYHNPVKVVPEEYSWTVQQEFEMLPHSFYIIAIPANDIIDVSGTIEIKPEYTVYPNPANKQLNLYFSIEQSGSISFEIQNLLGESMEKINGKYYSAGHHTVLIDISDLSAGIYFCTMKIGNRIETKKIVVME